MNQTMMRPRSVNGATPKNDERVARILARERRLEAMSAALKKPLVRVMQIDGFVGKSPDHDYIFSGDADGDCIFSGASDELRKSGSDLAVRVHIHPDATKDQVLRLLKKMRTQIKQGDWLDSELRQLKTDVVDTYDDLDDVPF